MGRNTFWHFCEGVLLRGAVDETGCCAVAERERDAIQGGDVEERLGGEKNQRKTLKSLTLQTSIMIGSIMKIHLALIYLLTTMLILILLNLKVNK
ncbi:hypothetical protein MRB53_010031 [Persea americana]|uniref:Uncharacterized protein n=1 Tax=Persea americana TaxID=3435 RepID=A0ACC2LQU5_PERAE|nr:hypothetical protein MRB53_010031 [Persea americana]